MMRRACFLRSSAGVMTVAALPALARRALAADTLDITLTARALPFAPVAGMTFAGVVLLRGST